jgi:hypothetical protein
MRRMNSDTLQFDDIKNTATKDLELGAFNATDKCGRACRMRSRRATGIR